MKSKEILLEILTLLKSSKANQKSIMTVLECSSYMNVSKDKIRELIHKADTDFPFFKVGSKVLIHKSNLDLWLDKISKEHRIL